MKEDLEVGQTTETLFSHKPTVRLNKSLTGKYSWEIKASDEDLTKLKSTIRELNNFLLEEYPEPKKRGGR